MKPSIESEQIHGESVSTEAKSAHEGPVWDRVGNAFERKTQKNPAKRIAANARSTVARG